MLTALHSAHVTHYTLAKWTRSEVQCCLFLQQTITASLAESPMSCSKTSEVGKMHQSFCTTCQQLHLWPIPDYWHWLWDNKQWHHRMRGSISSKICWLTPRDIDQTAGYTSSSSFSFFSPRLACWHSPYTWERQGKEKKNRVIKNKHSHNFSLSLSAEPNCRLI